MREQTLPEALEWVWRGYPTATERAIKAQKLPGGWCDRDDGFLQALAALEIVRAGPVNSARLFALQAVRIQLLRPIAALLHDYPPRQQQLNCAAISRGIFLHTQADQANP